MFRRLACLSAVALLPALAGADDVMLKGGGKISGRILSRTEKAVEVDVGAGTVTIPMTSVVRIDEKRSALDDYYERAEHLRQDDVAGWMKLASWASTQGLGTQARTAFEHVIAVDPGNAEAHQALGHVLLEGRWVTQEESYRARGYVQFEGEWMTPAEQNAILAQRTAAQQAEIDRLDAERRAREAEARAREAESAVPGNAGFPLYWGGYWGPGPSTWPSRPVATPPPRPAPPIARPPSRASRPPDGSEP